MITDLQVYTDYSSIKERLIPTDTPGELFVLQAIEETVRIAYRSEPIRNINDRDGSLIMIAQMQRSNLASLHAVAMSLLTLRKELEQSKRMHFKKIKAFNDSATKEKYVRGINSRIGGRLPQKVEFSSLDFSSPLKVRMIENDPMILEPIDWFSRVDRFAVCAHALGMNKDIIAMPLSYSPALIEDLASKCSALVLPKGKWEEMELSRGKSHARFSLREYLFRRKDGMGRKEREIEVFPESHLSFSSEVVPVSLGMRQLAHDCEIGPDDVLDIISMMSVIELRQKPQAWHWRMALNDVAVVIAAMGGGLKSFSYDSENSEMSLVFSSGETFNIIHEAYSFNRVNSDIAQLEFRLRMFDLLNERLIRNGFVKLEAGWL